jgi:cell division protein FtsL
MAVVAEQASAALPRLGPIPRTLLAASALLVVAAVGVFQVLQTSKAATTGYELGTLERQRDDLNAQIRTLEAQIAQSAGEGQVRELAMARLGMVPAQDVVRITVDVPAPAVPALPERYVVRPQPSAPPPAAWWQQLLEQVPGFE